MTTVAVPQRLQRVVGIRWLYAGLLLAIGCGCLAVTGGAAYEAVGLGAVVLTFNGLIAIMLRRRPHRAARLILPQIIADSLLTVAAVHYGQVLTPAVQFLFLFPLIAATLLWPREGVFLVAGLCSVAYAAAVALELRGYWTVSDGQGPNDRILGALTATSMVVTALLAAAGILNYLLRTLDGIEQDLARSEDAYRKLACSLEEQVRQRTSDLQHSNDALAARNLELVQIQGVNAAIHASDDLGTVLQRVVDAVGEILPHAEAMVVLREPDSDQLRIARVSTSAERLLAAVEGYLGYPVRDARLMLPPGTPLELAVRTRQLVISHDLASLIGRHLGPRQAAGGVDDIVRTLGFRTALAVPLVMGDELVGLLAVGSRAVLDRDDVERIEIFATQAAIAVHRVRQEQILLEHQASLEQAYHELHHSHEQVVNLEKMRAIGEMTSGVAHNFNNSLTAILGTAQLALREDLPQTVAYRLRVIEQVAQDASLLVQRLRAFARDERLQTSIVAPNELIRDAVAITEPRWKHHADRVEWPIEVTIEARARRTVEVDAAAIREVLVNLILNAVNAMPRGGRITLRTWDEGDQVRIAVADTGVGMDEETRRRCFEPFYTTGGKQGTGLGLSIAYGVLQRHEGAIEVTSTLGAGTEFQLTLPAPAHLPAAPATPEPPALVAAPSPPPVVAPTQVLVVDDQAMVRQTLGEMLRALGHSTTLCAGGQEALEVFDPRRHRIVVTDWGMPGMSGLQVARAIKGRAAGTKVVLVTGFDANLPADVAESDEVDARLQKPVALNTLAACLARVLADDGPARAVTA